MFFPPGWVRGLLIAEKIHIPVDQACTVDIITAVELREDLINGFFAVIGIVLVVIQVETTSILRFLRVDRSHKGIFLGGTVAGIDLFDHHTGVFPAILAAQFGYFTVEAFRAIYDPAIAVIDIGGNKGKVEGTVGQILLPEEGLNDAGQFVKGNLFANIKAIGLDHTHGKTSCFSGENPGSIDQMPPGFSQKRDKKMKRRVKISCLRPYYSTGLNKFQGVVY